MKNIPILIFLLLLSCGTRSNDSPTADTATNSNQEDFDEFFKKFTTDSLFQIERVKFPFRVRWTTEDGETVHETAKEDWMHSTFYYEDSYATRQVDAYTQEIKNYGDSVKLEQRGVGQWNLC